MNRAVTWYFSRALGVVGLFTGGFQLAWAAITGSGPGELLASLGTAILLAVGGMMVGAIVDVVVQVRKRSRLREPGRSPHHRKR
ncbi:hypothetical protein [Azospirillum sp. TSO22-1]|uniref:hypothetical protein n=1 Tax=Azospirillum sp. TSO22-1 TaxID=716789 RepID=UPI000D608589|nr:hypothetical protein [Azospirillum sp. TSO22-1]PWC53414.1 hypothetical protein TSO221_10845 [Azospirillum sp. TSO22-1]